MLIAGIDVGASYTKAVLCEEERVVARACVSTGFQFAAAAERALDEALAQAGRPRGELGYVAATGFGRHLVPFRDLAVTDLTAQAWAVHVRLPRVRTVLDVGGQNVKAIRIDEHGRVRGFRLNDKCAAGSGAFLEKTLRYMGYTVEDIVRLVEAAASPALVSSVCAVFAESEIINHLVDGRSAEDVCAGALQALAGRAAQLVKRLNGDGDFALTGGLSEVPSMKRFLEAEAKAEFLLLPGGEGRFASALGAAILASRRVSRLEQRIPA